MIRVCKDGMTGNIVYEVWMAGDRYGLTYTTRKDAEQAELRYAAAYSHQSDALYQMCLTLLKEAEDAAGNACQREESE